MLEYISSTLQKAFRKY